MHKRSRLMSAKRSLIRALLKEVYPSVRAVAFSVVSDEKLIIRFYLDKQVDEDDLEVMSCVATEVIADMEFVDIEEQCVFSSLPMDDLDRLDGFVYARRE